MSKIKLLSSDGEIFNVDVHLLEDSEALKPFLGHFSEGGVEEGQVIALPVVSSDILKKILEWISYHKDEGPVPDNRKVINDIFPCFCLLDIPKNVLEELYSAATYLGINKLLWAIIRVWLSNKSDSTLTLSDNSEQH